jgi:hypothetical protein
VNGNGEIIWRWARRALGAIGFITILVIEVAVEVDISLALYATVWGLLGLTELLDAIGRLKA